MPFSQPLIQFNPAPSSSHSNRGPRPSSHRQNLQKVRIGTHIHRTYTLPIYVQIQTQIQIQGLRQGGSVDEMRCLPPRWLDGRRWTRTTTKPRPTHVCHCNVGTWPHNLRPSIHVSIVRWMLAEKRKPWHPGITHVASPTLQLGTAFRSDQWLQQQRGWGRGGEGYQSFQVGRYR
ncbi:hypothetical protein LX36DRAFT_341927 [Colletotrichum falcatum]|nr:hypothetical protein LX36DRAFT_341927 [Colletotrichum falcatum]